MKDADDAEGDDDAALEGERYQGVRDLFRHAREHGFDEDPPARIDALLMAAARQHAPHPAEKAGAFERVRRWLVATMMQPAVAGAVAIAVIGGTAGVLYMKGKGGVAEPTVGSDMGSPGPEAKRPELPDGYGDQPPPNFGTQPGSAAASAAAAEADELRARLRELEAREDLERRKSQMATERESRARTGPGGGAGGDGRGGRLTGGDVNDPLGGEGGSFDYKPDDRDTATVITTDDGKIGEKQVAVGGVKTQIESPTPPPDGAGATEQEEHVDEVTGRTPDTADTRLGSTRTPPSKRAQAENLLRQARTAAKKKDCNTVRTMAKRAKQLDAAYYKETFSRDAAVKDCL